jgi:hypothetical protein
MPRANFAKIEEAIPFAGEALSHFQ